MPNIDKLSRVIQNWLETDDSPTWENLYPVIHDAQTAFETQK